MKKIATRFAVTAAAVSMAFSPVAAHANTRAGDNGSIYGAEASSAGAIFGAVYDDEDEIGGIWDVISGLLAAAAIVTILIIIDDDTDQSPGT